MSTTFKKLTKTRLIFTIISCIMVSSVCSNAQIDIQIENGSFEDNSSNSSIESWKYKTTYSFEEDVPNGNNGIWSFKTNPGSLEDLELNITYQPIHNAPTNGQAIVRGWAKILNGPEFLEDKVNIGIAKIDKNNNWDFLTTKGTDDIKWDLLIAICHFNLLPSDTLVVFIDPGFSNGNIEDTEVLFDGFQLDIAIGTDDIFIDQDKFISLQPNPSSYSTSIGWYSYKPYKIYITNILGKSTLIESNYGNGKNVFHLDTSKYSSGLYIVSIQTAQGRMNQKLIIR